MAAVITPEEGGQKSIELLNKLHRPELGVYVSEVRDIKKIAGDIDVIRERSIQDPRSIVVITDFDLTMTQIPDPDKREPHILDRFIPSGCPDSKLFSTIGLPSLLYILEEQTDYNARTNELWMRILKAESQPANSLAEINGRDEEIFQLYREAMELVQQTELTKDEIEFLAGYLRPREGLYDLLETLSERNGNTHIVSAGIEPFIQAFIKIHDLPQIPIHANKVILDIDGKAIHPQQIDKLRTIYPEIQEQTEGNRRFVSPGSKRIILLQLISQLYNGMAITIGDSPSDAKIFNLERDPNPSQEFGVHKPKAGLKVGLLNYHNPELQADFGELSPEEQNRLRTKFQHKLNIFLQEFDFVITENASLNFITDLVSLLFPRPQH